MRVDIPDETGVECSSHRRTVRSEQLRTVSILLILAVSSFQNKGFYNEWSEEDEKMLVVSPFQNEGLYNILNRMGV